MSGKDDGAYMAPERKPHPMREDVARRCAVNFRYWLNRTTMQQLPPWPLMRDDMRQRFLEEADRILSLFDGENALRLRFTCPLCGTLNAPTRGDVVVGDRYQCSECETALVFSVASPELDEMHDAVFAPAPAEAAPTPARKERAMPSETPNLQEIADDLEAQIHECCDSDDGDAVCHRCGVGMNAVDALRASHQERDADARRLAKAAYNVCERWHRCRNDRRDAHGMDAATDALYHAAYAVEQRIDAAMALDTQTEGESDGPRHGE